MLIEKSFGEKRKFGSDTQWDFQSCRVFLEGSNVCDFLPGFRDGQHEGASAKAKRVVQDHDLAISAAFFLQHVEAGDSKVNAALTYADYNVAGTLEDDTEFRQGG